MYMYGTANSEYLPFMHLGEHDYTVRDWMYEYGAGGNIIDLAGNLAKDVGILSDNGWKLKETIIWDVLQHHLLLPGVQKTTIT